MSRPKPIRRPRTPEIAAVTHGIGSGGDDPEHYASYRLIAVRASAVDPGWGLHGGASDDFQKTAERMFYLWHRAVASIDAWERTAHWATDERVTTDCTVFRSFVRDEADKVRARAASVTDLAVLPLRMPVSLLPALKAFAAERQAFLAWADLETSKPHPPPAEVALGRGYQLLHLWRHADLLTTVFREAFVLWRDNPTATSAHRLMTCIVEATTHMQTAPGQLASAIKLHQGFHDQATGGNVIDFATKRPRFA